MSNIISMSYNNPMDKIIDWFLITVFVSCLISFAYFCYHSDPSDHMQKDDSVEVMHIVSETNISCDSKRIVVIKEE